MSFIGLGINLWQPNENFAPGWVLNAGGKPATLDIDFTTGRAFAQPAGIQTVAGLLTCTRASDGYYQNAAGVLLTGFGNNVLRTGTNGLLVEESRTNLALQSNTFTVTWTNTNITNLTTTTTGPDNGATSATLLNETVTNGIHEIAQVFVKAASALAYSFSFYAKSGVGRTRVFAQMDDGAGNGATVTFDLAGFQIGVAAAGLGAGPFTAISATITQLASTGWCFCTLNATSNTAVALNVHIRDDNAAGTAAASNSYVGTVGNGVYIFGAQLEQAAFATSYIPTTTVAVTRAQENVVLTTPSGVVNVASHSFYAQVNNTPVGFNNNNTIIETDAGTGSRIFAVNNTATAVTNGANQLNSNAFGAGSFSTATIKVAYSSAAGGRSVVGQGGTPTTDANSQGTPSKMGLGISNAGTNGLFGYMKRVAFWNSRLTDAQLTALTT